mgnify:FL=1
MNKNKKKIVILLPARISSTRIKTKLLKKIHGIPIILHTILRIKLVKNINKIIVCTDSKEIQKLVKPYGITAVMTAKHHKNGTERIAEVAKTIKADLFIDVHSDEAIINPKNVEKLISFHLKKNNFDIVVPHKVSNFSGGENIVKVIYNFKNQKVLYFSRSDSPYPFRKKKGVYFHHLDTISFKPKALKKFSKVKQGELEKIEGIELMRALENNLHVGTFSIKTDTFSINTPKDFKKAKSFLIKDKFFKKYREKI